MARWFIFTFFVFAVAEKCTCQSKWGECSLTSENSLFKLVWWPRAEYSKCLNTQWGIYEKCGYVVLHSKKALHSLEKESGNVDLYALEYMHTYTVLHTHLCTCTHIQKTEKLLSHISHLNSGDVISNNYRWPLPVPSGCCLWASRDNSRSQWRVCSRKKQEC